MRARRYSGCLVILSTTLVSLCPLQVDGAEKSYNGIELPEDWPPPNYGAHTPEPMRVPYLESPPKVIDIDVGRQLFIDDFSIDRTTLKRTFHQPIYYEGNPVIKPDKQWENHGPSPFAIKCTIRPNRPSLDSRRQLWK